MMEIVCMAAAVQTRDDWTVFFAASSSLLRRHRLPPALPLDSPLVFAAQPSLPSARLRSHADPTLSDVANELRPEI